MLVRDHVIRDRDIERKLSTFDIGKFSVWLGFTGAAAFEVIIGSKGCDQKSFHLAKHLAGPPLRMLGPLSYKLESSQAR